jgi:succinate dehydrogenase flavin-adding protein (antitoxin of CptAB toxin-antitoxin module)
MSDLNSVYSAASELGIDVATLDEGSDFETETESTEAIGEVNEEAVNTEALDDGESDEPTLEGEETEAPIEAPEMEAPIKEEPKLTAKEFQEIQAAKETLELERKAFTEEKVQVEKEFRAQYHEKVQAHDELDSFLTETAQNDPDLFEVIKEKFQAHQKQFNNPVINELKEQNKALNEKLDSFLNKASDEVTRTKLDSEMNQVKSTLGKEAEIAGIKVDWLKVEDAWADNPKLSLENAFYAMYGANLTKAAASKAKVEAVQKKVQARPAVATAGAVKSSNAPTKAAVPSNTFDAVRYFAKQLTGKS